ncbi:MAG: DNA primase [Planctomycetes bacterium RIFCSPHIGHO2_12_FULL_52_36]|nr:MAG: DNA primase [Planctomycetes bacterium RIFCSPHIGHO2_12_FULL_52_36]
MTGTVRIPREKIEEVQRYTDIVVIVSQHVPLNRRGKNYIGLCPFHNEKTPSFTVSQEKQFYKCFGCGEGGSVFNFLMKKEGLSFSEAVRSLARKAGVDIPQRRDASYEKRDYLYQANNLAAGFFQACLSSEEGRQAREYLDKRGIDRGSIEKFRIGYAPDRWDGLLTAAQGKGISAETLLGAGLVIAREGKKGCYDRFRNRLMFPISDLTGKVIAFGGRSLDGKEPKYLNSPETALFHKGGCLYGVDLARGDIFREKKVLVMEGYTDVIMAHQYGISWAVGLLGTALSEEHVRLLRPWTEVVVLVMDGDAPGLKSAERNVETLIREDVETRIAELPEGYDPCDLLLKEGRDSFLEKVGGAAEFFDFKVKRASQRLGLSTPSGKLAFARELIPLIAQIPDELKRQLTIKHLAEQIAAEEGILRRSLLSVLRNAQLSNQQLSRQNSGGLKKGSAETGKATYRDETEKELLGLLLAHNELIGEYLLEVGHNKFINQAINQLAEKAFEIYKERGKVTEKDLAPLFDEGEVARVLVDVAMEEEKGDYRRHFADCLNFMKRRENREKISYTKERAIESKSHQQGEEDRLLLEFHERNKVRARQLVPKDKTRSGQSESVGGL